jgi:secreted protein with Ig-like and vWFA domain
MSAERSLIIFVLAVLALGASGYLVVFINSKFAPLGAAAIFLALFLFLGLVAHATPKGQVLERSSLK